MKRITKKIAIFAMVCVMVLSIALLVACNGNTYTVKVVGTDGKPYQGALVQLCKVEANGSLSTCYNGVPTDSKGVTTLTIGKEIPEGVNEVEVHVLDLPSYLTYDAVRMTKGKKVTITLKNNLSTPMSGTGEGSYGKDGLGNDTLTMDPYVVGEKSYELKFTTATQLIFYEFRALEEGIYKVYSVGDVDASVTQLTGTEMTGIRNPHDARFTNDNVSETDKNFSYTFEVSPELMEQTKGMSEDINYGSVYFEVSLKNADHVNKSAIIVFEYVEEYAPTPEVETVPVHPSKTLTVYDGGGEYYSGVNLDGTTVLVKDSDGYYHLDDEDGAIVVATLGNDTVTPDVLEMSFLNIYTQGQTLTFYDSALGKNKNYAPLVEAYTSACNDDGRYPLTDELIDFFKAYIANVCSAAWLNEQLNTLLPEGQEWLIWCGYYYSGSTGSGTEDDPIALTDGLQTITVAAGGSTYYSLRTMGVAPSVTLMADATNISLTWYNAFNPQGTTTVTSDDVDGLYVEINNLEAMSNYVFVFSTKDGAAATYTVNVIVDIPTDPEGTADNPIVIDDFGTFEAQVEEVQSPFGFAVVEPIYYTYTVKAGDTKLYFDWGENTEIQVIVGYSYLYSSSPEEAAQLANGVDVSELVGETITIIVGTLNGEAGDVSFTISNSAISA